MQFFFVLCRTYTSPLSSPPHKSSPGINYSRPPSQLSPFCLCKHPNFLFPHSLFLFACFLFFAELSARGEGGEGDSDRAAKEHHDCLALISDVTADAMLASSGGGIPSTAVVPFGKVRFFLHHIMFPKYVLNCPFLFAMSQMGSSGALDPTSTWTELSLAVENAGKLARCSNR